MVDHNSTENQGWTLAQGEGSRACAGLYEIINFLVN